MAEDIMITLCRAARFGLITILVAASSAATETDYEISVNVMRVRQSECEFILRVEVRGPRGLGGGQTEMRLRPGSAPRGESLSRGPDGTRKRTIHAKLNDEGTELWYNIQIIHDDETVASKTDIVNVAALPKRD